MGPTTGPIVSVKCGLSLSQTQMHLKGAIKEETPLSQLSIYKINLTQLVPHKEQAIYIQQPQIRKKDKRTMGHHSCCNQQKVKRGLWSPEEDEKLIRYITTHGYGCWSEVPEKAGLSLSLSHSCVHAYIVFKFPRQHSLSQSRVRLHIVFVRF